MRVFHNYLAATFFGLALAALACDDSTGPTTRVIEITVTTNGTGLDIDGYTVTMDNMVSYAVPANGKLTVPNVMLGNHVFRLTGQASNCTVVTPNPSTINVTTAGATAGVSFSVVCSAPPEDECGYYDYDCNYSLEPATIEELTQSSKTIHRVSIPTWRRR